MSETDPKCLSIILCDQVIEDKRTNKKSLIGTFNDIMVAGIPAKHPCMCLMLSVTNCRHEREIQIEILRDTEQGVEQLLTMQGRIRAKTPLDVIDLVFEMRGVPLQSLGQYTIDVTTQPDGARLAQRSFSVRPLVINPGTPPQAPQPE